MRSSGSARRSPSSITRFKPSAIGARLLCFQPHPQRPVWGWGPKPKTWPGAGAPNQKPGLGLGPQTKNLAWGWAPNHNTWPGTFARPLGFRQRTTRGCGKKLAEGLARLTAAPREAVRTHVRERDAQ